MYIYDIHLFQAALWHIFSICISAAKAERDCIKGKKGTQTVRNNRPKLVQALVCQARCEIPLGTELLVGLKSFCNPMPIQLSLQHFFSTRDPTQPEPFITLSCLLSHFLPPHTNEKETPSSFTVESKTL